MLPVSIRFDDSYFDQFRYDRVNLASTFWTSAVITSGQRVSKLCGAGASQSSDAVCSPCSAGSYSPATGALPAGRVKEKDTIVKLADRVMQTLAREAWSRD